jgi:hypothetical protein
MNEILEQLRHLSVEFRVCQLLADNGLADVVDDSLGNRVARQLALLVQLARNGVVNASFDGQRQ